MNEDEEHDLREKFAISITLGGLMMRRDNLLRDIEAGRCTPEDGVKRVQAVEAAIVCLDPEAELSSATSAFSKDTLGEQKLKAMVIRQLRTAGKPLSALQLAYGIRIERNESTNDLGAIRQLANTIDDCLTATIAAGRVVLLTTTPRSWTWVKQKSEKKQ